MMKSLQFLVGILCLNAIIGNSFADNEITLNKLIFKEESVKDGETATITVSFKATPLVSNKCKDHNLIFTYDSLIGKIKLLDVHSKEAPKPVGSDAQSIEFIINTADYSKITKKNVKLQLYSHIAPGNTMEGHTPINMENPVVLTDGIKITTINKQIDGVCDLRISNTVPDGFTISGPKDLPDGGVPCPPTPPDTSKACYFMMITVADDDKFSACRNIATEGGKLLLCSEPFDAEPVTKGFTSGTITVNYQTPQITISAKTATTTATAEMVLHDGVTAGATPDVCEAATLSNIVCTVSVPGNQDVLLVGLDGTKLVTEYNKLNVQDLEPDAQLLGSGSKIIEVSIMNVGSKTFHMKRNKGNEHDDIHDESYQEVDVDCSEITDSPCRGYFVDLILGTYQITVNTIENDKIKYISKEVPITELTSESNKDLKVEDIHVRQEVTENIAQFCFMYNQEITKKTALYEVILINKKGKWKRTTMETELDDNHDCSTAIDFPLEQFDEDFKIKMLVIARDINTDKVLASAEKTLQISAPKNIKPATDTSSNGYTRILAIVGAAVGGVACMVALVAAAVLLVMKRNINNDGLQYPLHRTSIENSDIVHGLENPYSTM